MASSEPADVACRQEPGDVAVGADQHRVGLAEAVAPLDVAVGVDEVLPDDEHLHRDVRHGPRRRRASLDRPDRRAGSAGPSNRSMVDRRSPAWVDPGVWGPGSRRGVDHGAVLRRGRLGVRLDGARRVDDAEVVAQVVARAPARTPRARPGRCAGRRGIAPRRTSRAVILRPARAPPSRASSRGCGRRRSRCSCRWRRGASCGGPRRRRGTPAPAWMPRCHGGGEGPGEGPEHLHLEVGHARGRADAGDRALLGPIGGGLAALGVERAVEHRTDHRCRTARRRACPRRREPCARRSARR